MSLMACMPDNLGLLIVTLYGTDTELDIYFAHGKVNKYHYVSQLNANIANLNTVCVVLNYYCYRPTWFKIKQHLVLPLLVQWLSTALPISTFAVNLGQE